MYISLSPKHDFVYKSQRHKDVFYVKNKTTKITIKYTCANFKCEQSEYITNSYYVHKNTLKLVNNKSIVL